LRGQTATSELAVGAHSAHVEAGPLADAFACSECHVTPSSLLEAGHLGADSIAEITWGAVAQAPGANWDRGLATCSDTYCHGNFGGGDNGNTPIWTATNQANCGSCHDVGSNPGDLGGRHEKHVSEEGLSCNRCHSLTVDLALDITGTSIHVNGQGDVNFSTGQGSFNGNTCSALGAGCHGTESWY
jgi:predicted CxxxxCH...CXXCH cytochrome family protein